MASSKFLRSALQILLVLAIVLFPAVALADRPAPPQGVHSTPIGDPTWAPVDFHLFSAPIGTAASGYARVRRHGAGPAA